MWSFHLAPQVQVELTPEGALLSRDGRRWLLGWGDGALEASVEPSWVSPSYGVKVDSQVVRLRRQATAVDNREWSFNIRQA